MEIGALLVSGSLCFWIRHTNRACGYTNAELTCAAGNNRKRNQIGYGLHNVQIGTKDVIDVASSTGECGQGSYGVVRHYMAGVHEAYSH